MSDVSHTMGMGGGAECVAPDLQDGDVLAFHPSASGGPELCVRALRPTLHPELADVVEAQHREALRRHGVAGMVSMTSPLRAMSATWLLVAEAPGDGCLASLHTRAIFDATGFRVLRALGDEGEFLYPNERYRSYVMDIDLVRVAVESSHVVCKAIHEETLR
jgi:hypothetical protein